MRGKIGGVSVDECLLQRQRIGQGILDRDDGRSKVGRQAAALVDDRLQALAHRADQGPFAQRLGSGLRFLDLVGDDVVRQRLQRVRERPRDFAAIHLRGAIARFALAGDDRAGRHAAQELVGGLLLQRLDPFGVRERGVIPGAEHIELEQRREQLSLGRLVRDVVFRERALGVAAHLGCKGAKLRVVADHVLDPAVDRVGEPRQVGRLVDALPGLAGRRADHAQYEQDCKNSGKHVS